MIGILKYTEAGWFVWYQVMRDEITSGYDSLPLYQEIFEPTANQSIIPLVDGKTVEFEIVIEDKTRLTVAKLISQREDKAYNTELLPIRQYSDDPDGMNGDPLEGLGQLFDFIAVIFALGILTLVIEIVIWIIH